MYCVSRWVTLVSHGLEAGAVIAADRRIDPTIAVSGTYILYWTSRSAYVLTGVNLVFVPSLFFGNTPANFYAATGWGTTALMGAVFIWWLLALGVAVYRSGGRAGGGKRGGGGGVGLVRSSA